MIKFNCYLTFFGLILFILGLFEQYEASISIAKCTSGSSEPVLVETKSGPVQGSCSFVDIEDKESYRSANVYSWLSIPYAQSPVNEKRFRAPVPIEPWTVTIDGTKIPNSCMQLVNRNISRKFEFLTQFSLQMNSRSKISEDCLYLNIWAPIDAYAKISMQDAQHSVPILVILHGGEGASGSSMLDIHNPSRFYF